MNGLNKGNARPTEEAVRKFIEERLPAFQYIGGYQGSDSSVVLECRTCGILLRKNMRTIRKPTCSRACPSCEARKRQEAEQARREAKVAEKEARRKRKEQQKNREPVACKCCGSLFIPAGSRRSYCSPECSRRVANNHKDKRLKGQAGKDWDITVPALVQRDQNICYLCGGECDSTDYHITDAGHFIAGPLYPSIDHVLPVSKGGRHKWNNVRLAHIKCNTRKRDKTL